jgi:hypothetical protein
MADCRTVRQETSEYDFFASVGDHRESRRRFRIVPGALIYGRRPHPSTRRIKKSDVKSLYPSIHAGRAQPCIPQRPAQSRQATRATDRERFNNRHRFTVRGSPASGAHKSGGGCAVLRISSPATGALSPASERSAKAVLSKGAARDDRG